MKNIFMRRKATRSMLVGIALIALLSGCEYEFIQPVKIPVNNELKFSTDIIPIFNQSCNMSGCHAAGAIAPDLTPANAYNSLMQLEMVDAANPTNSVLYKSMHEGSMKSFSTTVQTQTILQWIQLGAKNN